MKRYSVTFKHTKTGARMTQRYWTRKGAYESFICARLVAKDNGRPTRVTMNRHQKVVRKNGFHTMTEVLESYQNSYKK